MALQRFVVAAAIVLMTLGNAHSANRLALVIGNNDYMQVTDLQKAANDANAIADTLKSVGYEVLVARDATRREMNRQLQLFASRLNPGDEALFYFAGHGVEISGRNYLLPTDIPNASAGQEDFVTAEAIPVDVVLDRIRGRGTRISILIIDACRDNPFPKSGTRSLGGSRGLTRTIAPEGTFIMYSAGVGQTALDRLSDNDANPNSVFTRSLIPLLKQPGMSLIQTARQVRRDVQDLATTVSHDQRPAYYDEVTGDFFFAGRKEESKDAPEPPRQSVNPAAQAWSTIEDTASKAVLEAFIQRFPDSLYADFAKARLKELGQVDVALVSPQPTRQPQPGARAPVDDCDILAAHPEDPDAVVKGTEFDAINPARAIAACSAAVRKYPEEKRFAFQLARAVHATKDYKSAMSAYEALAREGYSAAQNNLGVMYDNGEGVSEDNAEAVKWYRKAADLGNARSQNSLGLMYQHGEGVDRDPAEAMKWYRKAAAQDNADALNNIAVMYDNGEGMPEDDVEAAKWYRLAAEKGSPEARTSLGYMYENGEGVAADINEAVKWYRLAAEQGFAQGQTNLGLMYQNGRGVPQDYAEAAKWYRRAADQGHAQGQTNLAILYDNGQGVPMDDLEAASWYRKAAEQGYDVAQTNLGVMYQNGEGVARDAREAVKWYRLAAEQGFPNAQTNLGVMYENGEGVGKNLSEAVKWYRKAAEQGFANGQYNLGVMYANGTGVARNQREAAKWYQLAADQDEATAQHNLGLMHMNGEGGLAKNDRKAAELISRAIHSSYDFSIKQMEENASAYPKSFRIELQRILSEAGVYNGALDGDFGPATQAAIRKYAGGNG